MERERLMRRGHSYSREGKLPDARTRRVLDALQGVVIVVIPLSPNVWARILELCPLTRSPNQ